MAAGTLHIVLDIETLSTRSNAAITQIGLADFIEGEDHILSSGSMAIDPSQYESRAFREAFDISFDTVMWQAKLPEHLQPRVGLGGYLSDALVVMVEHISGRRFEYENVRVWGNGPHFDAVIIEHAFDFFGMTPPWGYNHLRDVRTACELMGVKWKDFLDPATAHDAEADAVAEARGLIQAFQRVQPIQ